jgi:hypothetical protein
LLPTLATNKSTYATGETILVTGRVLRGSDSVSGQSIVISLLRTNNNPISKTVVTDSLGNFTANLKLSRKRDQTGQFTLRAETAIDGSMLAKEVSLTVVP